MEDLSANILIGLGTGLISGLVTGLYSGLIISRRNRFDSFRAELFRHVNSIEYMQETSHVLVNRGSCAKLFHVASDFAHFGHPVAAEAILSGNKRISSAVYDAERGAIDAGALEEQLQAVCDSFRSISPSFRLYLPWGQV